MEIDLNTKVGDIVRSNFKAAQIFEINQIDFCCGGGISLQEACSKKNLAPEPIIVQLQDAINRSDPDSKYFDNLPLDLLCDYIENRHHSYVSETSPFLVSKLEKLCEVHGMHHPELFEIRELFEATAANLTMHMKKEELMLFPAIRTLVKLQDSENPEDALVTHLAQMIQVMNDEHQAEGERLERIDLLSKGYTYPPDACNTYRVTYETLKEFQRDLHRHIHLENNILFIKALDLAKQTKAS